MTANQINYAKEREQERANLVNEAETKRHNQQMEWLQAYSNLLQQQYNAEVARSNQAREVETYRSNVARENETHRSNIVMENIRDFEAVTNRTNATIRSWEQGLAERQFAEQQRQNRINNIFNGIKTVTNALFGGAGLTSAGVFSLFA